MVLLMRENIEQNHSCPIPFFSYLLSHHFMLANIPLSGRINTPLSWPAASFTYKCGFGVRRHPWNVYEYLFSFLVSSSRYVPCLKGRTRPFSVLCKDHATSTECLV